MLAHFFHLASFPTFYCTILLANSESDLSFSSPPNFLYYLSHFSRSHGFRAGCSADPDPRPADRIILIGSSDFSILSFPLFFASSDFFYSFFWASTSSTFHLFWLFHSHFSALPSTQELIIWFDPEKGIAIGRTPNTLLSPTLSAEHGRSSLHGFRGTAIFARSVPKMLQAKVS